jgi:hypothetical protein
MQSTTHASSRSPLEWISGMISSSLSFTRRSSPDKSSSRLSFSRGVMSFPGMYHLLRSAISFAVFCKRGASLRSVSSKQVIVALPAGFCSSLVLHIGQVYAFVGPALWGLRSKPCGNTRATISVLTLKSKRLVWHFSADIADEVADKPFYDLIQVLSQSVDLSILLLNDPFQYGCYVVVACAIRPKAGIFCGLERSRGDRLDRI